MFTMGQTVVTLRQAKAADEELSCQLWEQLFTAVDDAARAQLSQAYQQALTARTVFRVQYFHRGLRCFRLKLYDLWWDDFDTEDEAREAYEQATARLKVGLVAGVQGWARELASSFKLLAGHVDLEVRLRLGLRLVPAWVDDLARLD